MCVCLCLCVCVFVAHNVCEQVLVTLCLARPGGPVDTHSQETFCFVQVTAQCFHCIKLDSLCSRSVMFPLFTTCVYFWTDQRNQWKQFVRQKLVSYELYSLCILVHTWRCPWWMKNWFPALFGTRCICCHTVRKKIPLYSVHLYACSYLKTDMVNWLGCCSDQTKTKNGEEIRSKWLWA